MTSINTNIGAIAALHTLRSINSQLDTTQNRVSTGYRVDVAADNAAYWSIATTMRSDGRALNAVQDAIGLGAAKVDVAYAGMESVIEVLTEFQAKLVAAKQPGVDKAKIQKELEQLKSQATSIAQSASFSGVNWLNTAITDIYDTAQSTTKLISAFVRDASGNVSIENTNVDLLRTALFNSTGGGILQADNRSPGTVGGIRNTIYNFAPLGGSVSEDYIFNGPLTFTDNSTAISFTINLDADDSATTTGPQSGFTQTYTIDRSTIDAVNPSWNGVVSNRAEWRQVLQSMIGNRVTILQDVMNPARYIIESKETSARGSSYYMSGVSSTLAGGLTGGLQNSPTVIYGSRAFTYSWWDGAFELKPTVEAYIAVTENGVGKTLTLTENTVIAALGTTNGEVNSLADYLQVLNYAFVDQGMGIKATHLGSGLIRYDLDDTINPEAGRKTSLGITGATDNIGNPPEIGLLDIDVTSNYSLDGYITGIQTMLAKAIDGAAFLGAVKTRLKIQENYNKHVIDVVAKGVGRLVDADMNEASSRLKALQSQQQLSLQALHIANSQPEHILQLFR
jgi:flagellin